MKNLKFKVGDVVTVADPNDPSHFKRFQLVLGTLPVAEGMVPYSLKSLQTGRIMGPQELNPYLETLIEDERSGFNMWKFTRTLVPDCSSNLAYFEGMYKVLTDQEKMIYLNE